MVLPPAVVERLQKEVIDRGRGAERRLERLIDLLFDEDGFDLQYRFTPTLTVADAFSAGHANCVSFTLLFLAMAEAAGIQAQARELARATDWHRDESALYEAGHINVEVRTARRRLIVDFSPLPVEAGAITSATYRLIPIEQAKAHFYNNRSAELLAELNPADARVWNDVALKLAPDLVGALNNRGVIESRLGRRDLAEEFFQRAMAVEPDNVNVMINLLNLYRHEGRQQEAAAVRARLKELDLRDPYFQWLLGRQFEADGELQQALHHFKRAVRIQPADPMLHLSLARAATALNLHQRAEQALGQAQELLSQEITVD